VADLKITTQDYFDNIISNISFDLKGGRKLGAEVVYPYAPVYNLEESDQTNSSGEKQYENISPGQYEFSLSSSMANYKIIGTDPAPPFILSPDQNLDFKVILASKNITSILVKVTPEGSSDPFIGAKVELNNISGYDEETTTDSNGSAFFPKTENVPFEVGEYTLKVTADGYQEYSETININEDQLSVEDVILVAN
jgi:hypothetical protein